MNNIQIVENWLNERRWQIQFEHDITEQSFSTINQVEIANCLKPYFDELQSMSLNGSYSTILKLIDYIEEQTTNLIYIVMLKGCADKDVSNVFIYNYLVNFTATATTTSNDLQVASNISKNQHLSESEKNQLLYRYIWYGPSSISNTNEAAAQKILRLFLEIYHIASGGYYDIKAVLPYCE